MQIKMSLLLGEYVNCPHSFSRPCTTISLFCLNTQLQTGYFRLENKLHSFVILKRGIDYSKPLPMRLSATVTRTPSSVDKRKKECVLFFLW